MHLLDNRIRDKLLYDISILVDLYGIDDSFSPIAALIRFLSFSSDYFGYSKEIFRLYTDYDQRNLLVLEILTAKQDLDTERQVFGLVRNHISENNIKLTISHLINLYLSHIHRKIIHSPEEISPLKELEFTG